MFPIATAAHDLPKSNTSINSFNYLLITGTAGSIVIDKVGGNQTTFASLPVGVWVPVGNAIRVRTASTATGIVVA